MKRVSVVLLSMCVTNLLSQPSYAAGGQSHGSDTQPVKVSVSNWESKLGFIKVENNDFKITYPNVDISNELKKKDIRIKQECGVIVPKESAATELEAFNVAQAESIVGDLVSSILGSSVGFLVDKLVGVFIGKIEDKLAKTLDSYTQAYTASHSPDFFYEKMGTNKQLANACFRFTRAYTETVEGREPEDKVAVELIGKIRLTDTGSAIKVKPLRLAFLKTQTDTENSKIAFSFGLKIDSVWSKDGLNMSEESVNVQFPVVNVTAINANACDSLKKSKQSRCKRNLVPSYKTVHHYDLSWNELAPQNLIPVSDDSNSSVAGDVNITATVAEAGLPPQYLEDLIEFFNQEKGTVETGLRDALIALLPDLTD